MSNRTVQPARIVLVEDNPADVRLFQHALTEVGEPFLLEVLADGEAALKYVQEHCTPSERTPCLIVLDLHLPRYNGEAVLRAIHGEPALSNVRVAVLTTAASPEKEASVLALGVHAYRQKPSDLDDFIALAAELVALCRESVAEAAGNAG